MNFDTFQFNGQIMANIRAQGYTTPTPIQEQTMGHVLQGRDLMGLAQTGTGKTAAYLLPLIQNLMARRNGRKGVRALVLAPTRELAEQIFEAARDLGRKTGLRFATIYGGVGIQPQLRSLDRGVDCVIACPGRLLDVMDRGAGDFSRLETLVLDEADHMFDMGFLPDLRRIMNRLPNERQTLMFSATMPHSIRQLAQEALNSPEHVAVKHQAPAETVSHATYPVPQHLKTKMLLKLLREQESGSSLIFTRTKHKAKQLAEQLNRAGHNAASLQGNLSQNKRQATMKAFRSGACTVLVATDIAARGIDVSKVACVYNYDMPDTPETYTHRIGRTGRAERSGQALSLTTRDDVSMLRAVERLLGKPMEKRQLEGFDYDAPFKGGAGPRPEQNRNGQGGNGRAGGGRSGNGRGGNGRSQGSPKQDARSGSGSGSGGKKPSGRSIFGQNEGGDGRSNTRRPRKASGPQSRGRNERRTEARSGQ